MGNFFMLQEIIRDDQLQLSLGSNLRFLKLKKCMSLVKLFPSRLLQNLEELIVENCDNLEQLFDLEGLNVDDGHVGLLPKLKNLYLNGLPKVRHICSWGSSMNDHLSSAPVSNIIFPKLNDMLLKSLPPSQASPLDIIPCNDFNMQTLIPLSQCSLLKRSVYLSEFFSFSLLIYIFLQFSFEHYFQLKKYRKFRLIFFLISFFPFSFFF